MGTRRKARECALQLLYMWEFERVLRPEAVYEFWQEHPDEDNDTRAFTMSLVSGVQEQVEQLDEWIRGASTNWRIDRMATVDRNILRIATFELWRLPDTPLKVILNEAIELGKRFGSEDSGAFVNGVLDKIGANVRSGTKP